MKDFETTKPDSPQDAPHGIVRPRTRSHTDDLDGSRAASQPVSRSHADPAALSAPELSHPANAAPLADLLTQLQESYGNIHVQRVVSEMNEAKSDPESKSGSAQSLDAGIKTEMESAFGESFGDVRVHNDSEAEKAADELGARAFTRGRDVYFGSGEHKPSTREGRELLAHELTHVIQQRGSSSGEQANSIGQVGDAFEQEADQAAASVLSGQRVQVANRAAAPGSQRNSKGAQRIGDYGTKVLNLGDTWTYTFDDLTVQTLLSSVADATVDTVHMTVPSGVTVSVVDLTGMNLQVRDPGGTNRRLILMIANRQVRGPRLIQVTLVKGNQVYVVTFQIPATAAAAPPAASAPPPGRPH